MTKHRFKIMLALGLVILLAAGYLWKRPGRQPDQASDESSRTVQVHRGVLELTVTADGVVQPINQVEVKSKASGQIVELTFEEGQEVRKGDLLMALDPTTARNDYEQAKADLELAEATAVQQENNEQRAEELFAKGMISQQERDAARVDYIRAKSSLVKTRAALSSADERLRDTRIHAPAPGIILSRNVEIGQIISSGVSNVGGGTLLATLADMEQVHVEANVDEVDVGLVEIGQIVAVTADAYPNEPYAGQVLRIAPLGKTQQNVTVFPVLILVHNKGRRLKAGMSASVNIEVFSKKDILLVPNEALIDPRTEQGKALFAQLRDTSTAGSTTHFAHDSLGSHRSGSRDHVTGMRAPPSDNMPQASSFAKQRIVMLKDGENTRPQEITVGASNYDDTEVLSGLREGDEVVIQSASRAQAAQREFSNRLRGMSGMRKAPTK